MDGATDEDHLIAAIWNLMCLAETEEKRPEMMDIPSRMKKDRIRGVDEEREGINRKNEQKPLISETESDLEKLREYGWL